jgi:hypothetical protein
MASPLYMKQSGPARQPYDIVDYIPQSRTKNVSADGNCRRMRGVNVLADGNCRRMRGIMFQLMEAAEG